MFWLSYECFSILCDVFLLKSVMSSHNICGGMVRNDQFSHSHKKQKDSLEGSLDEALFAAELEFPNILVPRLPHHTSNINIECAGTSGWSKQLYYLYWTSFLQH